MHLLLLVFFLSEITFSLAITCYNNENGKPAGTTCSGTYCLFMKYNTISDTSNPSLTVIRGCYNWQLNLAEMGCYRVASEGTMQNVVVCFCNSDKCNTEDLVNSTPKSPRQFDCEHSTLKRCTGYACTVTYCIPSSQFLHTSIFSCAWMTVAANQFFCHQRIWQI